MLNCLKLKPFKKILLLFFFVISTRFFSFFIQEQGFFFFLPLDGNALPCLHIHPSTILQLFNRGGKSFGDQLHKSVKMSVLIIHSFVHMNDSSIKVGILLTGHFYDDINNYP